MRRRLRRDHATARRSLPLRRLLAGQSHPEPLVTPSAVLRDQPARALADRRFHSRPQTATAGAPPRATSLWHRQLPGHAR